MNNAHEIFSSGLELVEVAGAEVEAEVEAGWEVPMLVPGQALTLAPQELRQKLPISLPAKAGH